MKKGVRLVFVVFIVFVLSVGFVSAGLLDWFKGIFGGDDSNLKGELASLGVSGDNSLIAYYKFDDDYQDSGGNNNHGTAIGNPQFVDGIIGRAVSLDGSNDYIEIKNSPSLENITESSFTFSSWYYANEKPPDIAKRDSHTLICKQGYHVGISFLNTLKFKYNLWETSGGTNNNKGQESSNKYNIKQWYHLAMVVDDNINKGTLYVNGVKVAEKSFKDPLRDYGKNPIRIGGCSDPGKDYDR